jgi:hypothetical protein
MVFYDLLTNITFVEFLKMLILKLTLFLISIVESNVLILIDEVYLKISLTIFIDSDKIKLIKMRIIFKTVYILYDKSNII